LLASARELNAAVCIFTHLVALFLMHRIRIRIACFGDSIRDSPAPLPHSFGQRNCVQRATLTLARTNTRTYTRLQQCFSSIAERFLFYFHELTRDFTHFFSATAISFEIVIPRGNNASHAACFPNTFHFSFFSMQLNGSRKQTQP